MLDQSCPAGQLESEGEGLEALARSHEEEFVSWPGEGLEERNDELRKRKGGKRTEPSAKLDATLWEAQERTQQQGLPQAFGNGEFLI